MQRRNWVRGLVISGKQALAPQCAQWLATRRRPLLQGRSHEQPKDRTIDEIAAEWSMDGSCGGSEFRFRRLCQNHT